MWQALQGYEEGLEESALVLLQTFLGFAAVLGCAGFGLVLVRPSAQCLVSKQYLCQTALVGIGKSIYIHLLKFIYSPYYRIRRMFADQGYTLVSKHTSNAEHAKTK